MEKTEPTFVPEWYKSTGGLSSTSHQFTSSSLHADEQGQGVSKSARNKSLVNITDNELGRPSISDRTTSSYFRRPSSSSNGSSNHLRSYSSFGRNHRDRDRDWDEFRNKEKSRDYSDPLGNILPTRFKKDVLRRSHSSVSEKRGDSWPRKTTSDLNLNIANKSISVKTSFERDFPSLGADEKQADNDIGRVPSPGLSSAIQSLPAAVIGGDGWTSALAEVPVIVGSNGNGTSVAPPSVSATTTMIGGRNMAETLAHGPPRTQTAPQLTVGTQRLEELAVKQSRQLIPMTPSLPKALALNSSDKPKLKVGQAQLQSQHLVNHPHTPRPISVKPDAPKTSTGGKLLVLKPSRERNGISPTTKEGSSSSSSPTGGSGKLPNSPLAVPSAVGSAPPDRKPTVAITEKRPSSQAQSRSNFFNLMRKKSMTSNNSSTASSSCEKTVEPSVASEGGSESDLAVVKECSETKVDLTCNGDASSSKNNNGKNHDVILYSEEEEARFLRSLGWDETAEDEEEEGLTEEEISSFYRNYLNIKPELKFLKGTEGKLMMPIHSKMGEVSSSDSKLDA